MSNEITYERSTDHLGKMTGSLEQSDSLESQQAREEKTRGAKPVTQQSEPKIVSVPPLGC